MHRWLTLRPQIFYAPGLASACIEDPVCKNGVSKLAQAKKASPCTLPLPRPAGFHHQRIYWSSQKLVIVGNKIHIGQANLFRGGGVHRPSSFADNDTTQARRYRRRRGRESGIIVELATWIIQHAKYMHIIHLPSSWPRIEKLLSQGEIEKMVRALLAALHVRVEC